MTTEDLLHQDLDNDSFDENANYLELLVGDGKKFKTIEDLAKGKAYSDHYIKTLERQKDAISEDYRKVLDERNAMPKLQEFIDKLDTLQNLQTREPPINANEDLNRQNAFNPDDFRSLAAEEFNKLEQAKKESENYRQVQNKLRETLGNNYVSILKEKQEAMGLTDNEVNQMAKRNPNLFFKTFDLQGKTEESFQSPPRSTFRPKASSGEKRTWKFYETMRKEKPLLYLDPKIAVQMEKDAQELGAAFYD